jgi:hypothetical protein
MSKKIQTYFITCNNTKTYRVVERTSNSRTYDVAAVDVDRSVVVVIYVVVVVYHGWGWGRGRGRGWMVVETVYL